MVASKHDAKADGFEKFNKALPSKVLATFQWCHVFLTDRADKADSFHVSGHCCCCDDGMSVSTFMRSSATAATL